MTWGVILEKTVVSGIRVIILSGFVLFVFSFFGCCCGYGGVVFILILSLWEGNVLWVLNIIVGLSFKRRTLEGFNRFLSVLCVFLIVGIDIL